MAQQSRNKTGRGRPIYTSSRPKQPSKPTRHAPACKFCGCTERRPCAHGCAWYDADTCTRCAVTFHLGGEQATAEIIDALVAAEGAAELVEALRQLQATRGRHLRKIADMTAEVHKFVADVEAHPDEPQAFGKGRRSGDGIVERAAGGAA